MSLEDDPAVRESLKSIRRSLDQLDEINSSFDATRAFLAARGLTRVSQLDEQGRKDLIEHLRITLRNLLQ